ncbi:MAG: SDR family NAD(P)-dependent oxidoreductase, partial [Terriglobia bacterium]
MTETGPTPWGLIVGSSSGFGAATSLELARAGLNIFGVHFDRRSNMPQVERVMESIQDTGRDVLFFNINAADPAKRTEALNRMQEHWSKKGGDNFIKVFLHSVA